MADLRKRIAEGDDADVWALTPQQRQALEKHLAGFDLEATSKKLRDMDPAFMRTVRAWSDERLLTYYEARNAADALRSADYHRHQESIHTYVLTTPTPLFRSVSMPEIDDIFRTGAIIGRLNVWHPADKRRVVLFGDNGRIVSSQGEQVERLAILRLGQDHPLQRALAEARQALEGITSRHPDCDRLRRAERAAEVKRDEALKPLIQEEERRRASLPWTSAVVETRPMTGATVWPPGHKENWMGCAEYGMPSGAVLLSDLVHITLLHNRKPVASGAPDEIQALLDGQNDEVLELSGAPAGP